MGLAEEVSVGMWIAMNPTDTDSGAKKKVQKKRSENTLYSVCIYLDS
jgi:hypothetical protein